MCVNVNLQQARAGKDGMPLTIYIYIYIYIYISEFAKARQARAGKEGMPITGAGGPPDSRYMQQVLHRALIEHRGA